MLICKYYTSPSLIILLTVIATVQSSPLVTTEQAESYLSQYGYLPVSIGKRANYGTIFDANTWIKGVEELQKFFGLNSTGKLDSATLKLMSQPRCGVSDKYENNRSNRYSILGSRILANNLTYGIVNYPSNTSMNKKQVEYEIARAFAVWSEYINITFTDITETKGSPNVTIKFVSGEHGCSAPFVNTTLAHAISPNDQGGYIHFNNNVFWSHNLFQMGTATKHLFAVAVHEIGHSLGLGHSNNELAVMYPTHIYRMNFELNSDDIFAIQALYGKKSAVTSPHSSGASRDSRLCSDPEIDAIFYSADGKLNIFKGNLYYQLGENSVAHGYPKNISERWPDLPEYIDAAFMNGTETFFFKNDKYWLYNSSHMAPGFPRAISTDFPGVPNNLDTVLFLFTKNTIHFFKNDKVWHYDPIKNSLNADAQALDDFLLPNNLDAAIQYSNEKIYFFKRSRYYRLNDFEERIDSDYPHYTAMRWFGCQT